MLEAKQRNLLRIDLSFAGCGARSSFGQLGGYLNAPEFKWRSFGLQELFKV
jgi:hypothetical protein